MGLWLAAGQDGQQVFWLDIDSSNVDCDEDADLQNTTPPAFSPTGNEFMVVDEQHRACRFRYPDVHLVKRCRSPCDDPFDYPIQYLNTDIALARTRDGRHYALDVDTMRVIDEVVIKGHEPRPIEDLYPALVGSKQLATDILFFECVGHDVMFVHRSDKGADLKGWKDSLVCFSIDDLIPSLVG
jgi:hypothetical protein